MTISIPNSKTASVTITDPAPGAPSELSLIYGDDVYKPLEETSEAFILLENHLKSLPSTAGIKVADFGAGSGQFAVWTKNFFPDTDVHAYEIDPNAEKYINANAELYGVAVTAHITDVANISDSEEFDAIISSPPFIPEVVKTMPGGQNLIDNHRVDPEVSVFGGYKGLAVSQIFIEKAGKTLKSGGILVSVHSVLQGDDIQQILEANGFGNITRSTQTIDYAFTNISNAGYTVAYKN